MKFVLKINLRIFDNLGSKVLKRTFFRVVKSCPGDPGSGPGCRMFDMLFLK